MLGLLVNEMLLRLGFFGHQDGWVFLVWVATVLIQFDFGFAALQRVAGVCITGMVGAYLSDTHMEELVLY